MQGLEFMKERVKIETLYEKVDTLIKEKDFQGAKKNLEKSRKLLLKLSKIITGNEVQERSVFNMEIKGKHLSRRLDNLTAD